MQSYRRNFVERATYFFTVNVMNRSSRLLVDRIDALRAAVMSARIQAPFHIDAWVVLPGHMHCIWTLPPGDAEYPARWRLIKSAFSRHVPCGEEATASRMRKGERGIWQRRYWEHTVRDETDYAAHMDYVHFNPVKHGYVARPSDWPHATFHRCVARAVYPADWAGEPSVSAADEHTRP